MAEESIKIRSSIKVNVKIIIPCVHVRLYYSPETDYCLPLSRMARKEMDYNLKKVAHFFKFSLWIDRVFGLESPFDRSFRKHFSQLFFSCSIITHK